MKIEEIYAIPADGDGWRLLPNGNKLMLGDNIQAPYGLDIARIGERASIGAWARIGAWASIGERARIGERASIGAWASIGERARIGAWARIGERARIGEWASIGAWARIGERASIGEWARIPNKAYWNFSPLAVQGTLHLVINCAPGQINIGCKFFTFAEFKAASPEQRTAYQVAEGYTPEQCAEYIRIVEFVIANGVPERSE